MPDTSGVSDILSEIDDVIAWDGRSPDAMKWTATPPQPLLNPVMLEVDREAGSFLAVNERVRVRCTVPGMQPFERAYRVVEVRPAAADDLPEQTVTLLPSLPPEIPEEDR